jgi:hypothetical protein
MFPNEGGQKHLVKNRKYQWDIKEKESYRVESVEESWVK